MTLHTAKCKAAQHRYEQELAAFEHKYPDYCRACGGTGVVRNTENLAPFGEGPWMYTSEEACGACEGHCPRCGHPAPSDDKASERSESFLNRERACKQCGFVLGDSKQESAPRQPECLCWLMETIWTSEWPTEGGWYWFHGWTSTFDMQCNPKRTHLVEVREIAQGKICYITEGRFLYQTGGAYGLWQPAIIPDSPEEE
jgi:hypothetical protein